MMTPIQLIIVLFTLFALSRTILRYRDRVVSRNELVFWVVIWLSVIVLAVLPSVTSFFSTLFGVSNIIDIMVYLSIIVVFYLIFRLYVKIESLRQDITKLVRSLAKQHPEGSMPHFKDAAKRVERVDHGKKT